MKTDTQNHTFGHILSFISILFFALNIPATAYILKGWIDPAAYTLVRSGGGMLVCWIISLFVKNQRVQQKKDYLTFFLGGAFGLALFFFLFSYGIGKTSPIDASIILTMPPVMVLILSAFVFKEKITVRKMFGIFLALGGALMVILLQGHSGNHEGMIGNIFVLIAALLYGSYLVFTRDISRRYNPVILLRWFYLFAFVCAFPFCIKSFVGSELVQHPSATPILVMLFIAIFPSAVAYLLLSLAMRSLSSTVVSTYNYAIPIIASVAAILLKQATLRWDEPVATVLVIIGVYFVNFSVKKKPGAVK